MIDVEDLHTKHGAKISLGLILAVCVQIVVGGYWAGTLRADATNLTKKVDGIVSINREDINVMRRDVIMLRERMSSLEATINHLIVTLKEQQNVLPQQSK